jgi:putative RecB family exonuclease
VAVYSHSRLSSFENCPRQFQYRYVERIPIESESIEAFLGKRVHDVLERLNRFVARGLVPSLAKVLQRFRAEWSERFDAGRVRIVRAELAAESYRDLGERCLGNHYRRQYPFDRDETLGIEEHVAFSLDAGDRYRVQGYVDRLARASDGAHEIHDYKTGRFVPSQQSLDGDRQLALYQLGLADRFGAGEVRLVWHYLQRDQVRVSRRTADQLEALRGRTIELIDCIEAERDFDPKPSALCSWCEFNHLCPAYVKPAIKAASGEEGLAIRTSPPERRDRLEHPASGAEAAARSEAKPSEVNSWKASEAHQDALQLSTPVGRRPIPPQAAEGEQRSSGRASAQQPAAPAPHPAPRPAPAQLSLL